MEVNVSIIVPVYNAEKTIRYALNSLLRQSYKDFEVIIIDDGSTDETVNIIKEYVKDRILNIQFIEKEHEGVAAARNTALKVAKGEFIAFLDADDIYDDRYVEIMLENIDGKDVSFCSYKKVYDISFEQSADDDFDVIDMDREKIVDNLMYREIPTSMWCYMFRKKIIDDNNLKFTKKFRYAEDTEFLWKYIINCKNGMAVNEQLYCYYDNPKSVLNNLNWDKVQSADAIKRIYVYMQEKKYAGRGRFYAYMYPRTLLAIYKSFVKNNEDSLTQRFEKEYQMKKNMKILIKSPDLKIKCTAIMYIVWPDMCKQILKRVK